MAGLENAVAVPVAAAADSIPNNSRSTSTPQWLTDMMLERELDPNEVRAPQSRIPRVPDSLRKNEKHAEMFDPAVVAIGPYHCDKPHLSAMEDHKKEAAKAFAKPNARAHALYRKVTEIVVQCRDCYGGNDDDDDRLRLMSDDDFACMLFVDGCFVLQFVYMFVKDDFTEFTVGAHLHGLILRDIFLLENQLPYFLLKKLMEVKRVRIDEFLDRVAGTQGQRRRTGKENRSGKSTNERQQHPHPHLLAQFRERHLGPADDQASTQLARGSSEQSFRSAKELVEAGIKIRRGSTSFLRDVTFGPCLVWGKLSLPRIVVDDLTRSRLLNMIALEMSAGGGGGGGDYGVTSFVWFMDLLIYSADDVKELRQAGVLQNLLGSDEHLAELFNDIAKDLVPDQQAYHGVMESINRYYKFRPWVILNRMLHTHVGLILVLTVVATIFTMIQTFYTIYPPARQLAN